MKKTFLRSTLLVACAALLFTACKKEGVNENNTQNDDAALKAKAQAEVDAAKSSNARFAGEFNGMMGAAGFRTNGQPTIVEIAQRIPIFKSLVAAAVKTGLAGTLSSAEVNLTVFAPTDDAFAKLPAPFNNAAAINAITSAEQIAALKNILLYHVLGTEVKRNAIAPGRSSAVTLKPVVVADDNRVFLSNQFGLIAINGGSLAIITDVDASNGVIHVIEDVLIPPTQTIAQIAVGNPNFSTLVAALAKTNLVNVFTGSGNFTVFAPTNAAFARLPAPFNNAANISAISNQGQIDALANILKYHVTSTRYFTLDLGFLQPIETIAAAPNNRVVGVLGLNTGLVKGNKNPGFSFINPGNLLATNGVVQVIDQVLQP